MYETEKRKERIQKASENLRTWFSGGDQIGRGRVELGFQSKPTISFPPFLSSFTIIYALLNLTDFSNITLKNRTLY